MPCWKSILPIVLGASFLFLAGCGSRSPNYIELKEPASASALVLSADHPGLGFLIDREERLLLTTYRVANDPGDIEVVFAVIDKNEVVAHRDLWLAKARQNRTTHGKVIIADPQRDLAVLQLDMVPEGVRELKLASGTPGKDTPVQFMGAGSNSAIAWAAVCSTIQKLGPVEMPFEGNQTTTNQIIELAASSQQAHGMNGGPVINEDNEVVGVITSNTAPNGPLLCTDSSEIRVVVAAAYRMYAMWSYENKKYDQALDYSIRGLSIWDEDALGYNERGAAYSQKDQFERAVADYTKCIELEPGLALAYRNRGSAYFHVGKFKEAVADCTKAISLVPAYQSPYQIRMKAYAKLDMTKEAEADRLTLASFNKKDASTEDAPSGKWRVTEGGVSKPNPIYTSNPFEGGASGYGAGDSFNYGNGTSIPRPNYPRGYYYGYSGTRYINVHYYYNRYNSTGRMPSRSSGSVSGGGGARRR